MRPILILLLGGLMAGCQYEYLVKDPGQPGPVGIALCLPGTGGSLADSECRAVMEPLRQAGYRILYVDYPPQGFSCAKIRKKAAEIQTRVDAIRGDLPVIGFGGSQGAWILAQMDVDAAVLHGTGTRVVAASLRGKPVSLRLDLEPCNSRPVPRRILAINGEQDEVYGKPHQLERVTGLSCPDARECWGRHRGWVIALDSEVSDGRADHGFSGFGGELDPAWTRGDYPWSLPNTLDWMLRAGREAAAEKRAGE
jgi:pimeloyl-ACP methyl ester carboxylesterase